MDVSRFQVEQILKTLPIGYYIKRDVKVNLIDDESSFYDMMHDEISISYPMIERVCQSLPVSETIENDIRCLLYHECSHAFITPKNLNITSWLNVFEDERIESIFRDYYLGVNFREFVKRMNNYHGEQPSSANELYYQIVRYRKGPQHFLDRVHDIIVKYTTFSSRNDERDYYYEVKDLYLDIVHEFQNQNQNQAQSSQSNGQTSSNEQSNENLVNDDQSNTENEEQSSVENEEEVEHFGKGEVDSIIESAINKFDDSDTFQEVEKILSSVKHSQKQNGSAINAYSGVFDPRSVVRKDYKFFVQQNRVGHVKAFSKLHLNLFIDRSGSFCQNDLTVNKFLKALHKFENENSDFTFDLISCGVGQTIRKKNDRIQNPSSGGTGLTSEIFEQYKSLQYPGTTNINIVLYDGDASHRGTGQNFAAFNNNRCILIVDPENKDYVDRYCKNAKVIITQDYTDELKKHIINALQTLTR